MGEGGWAVTFENNGEKPSEALWGEVTIYFLEGPGCTRPADRRSGHTVGPTKRRSAQPDHQPRPVRVPHRLIMTSGDRTPGAVGQARPSLEWLRRSRAARSPIESTWVDTIDGSRDEHACPRPETTMPMAGPASSAVPRIADTRTCSARIAPIWSASPRTPLRSCRCRAKIVRHHSVLSKG